MKKQKRKTKKNLQLRESDLSWNTNRQKSS